MEVQIKMPDLATTSDEVRIIRWLAEVGSTIKLGEPLLEIETDKATMDVESITSGTLKVILASADDLVPVGQVIAIVESQEIIDQSLQVTSVVVPDVPKTTDAAPVTSKPIAARSMFARNKEAHASTNQSARQNEITLSATQREVARRLQESKQTVPHFYLNTSANAQRIVDIRSSFGRATPPQKVVWDAFFVKAAARALQQFSKMRYQFDGDRLLQRPSDSIGVAADVDDTLYVIAVENPLTLNINQISQQIASRLDRIRQGDAAAKKLIPTALTITNLGAENIESFMAIINPGEAAILAIGKVAPTVQVQGDQIVIQPRVNLSLSVDHRIANGKYAASFLSEIVKEIESF